MFYPAPTAGVLHDLAEIVLPQKFGIMRWLRVKFFMRLFIKKLPKIIAVSKQTRDDIVTHYKIPEERISVIYNGIKKFAETDKEYRPCGDNSYILYVSRIEHPGKNHIRLIEAYENVCREGITDHLVLAGNFKERHEEVVARVKSSEFSERIHLTGFISDSQLGSLYKNAGLYVCPSLYEGFGLTLVEAMDNGLPVVSSDKGSLKEVCGDAARLFDPYSVEEITSALRDVLKDSEAREELTRKGKERALTFDWDRHVEEALKIE